ncbi:hypothetical protein RDWZM_003452 [Blomia tropicalis]|uniref:Coiled-coil domain-containing protein 93 n=1 Tax=Blomia tropicalis TaxID=40697 RepID=A0A9Q0MIB5_BLOTA|nr:Coiled-coil domain-containing protein 93 [Blomia tropicalis]KAJ6224907.1 hypothetical protein RDWZM_003452 [Blomia tropicalis]
MEGHKVPSPRNSLLNKVSSENGKTVQINVKPHLAPKPKPLIKPKNVTPQPAKVQQTSSDIKINHIERNKSTSIDYKDCQINSPKDKTIKVKVCNKLNISASDLNKLRFRTDFIDINKNVENKGNYVIYDIREDEEQIAKMGEISELLVAGGYFRARIKGLHNFDKIIGGMCWAIQMCNVDLDIDIFYQESLSIGQKISLTEKIVRVLQKMKCPFKLEPHQIQGLDCIHIFPVIQWLVKKSFETRQQTSEYLRTYAIWQFNRCYNHQDSSMDSVIFNDFESANQIVNPIKAQLRRRFIHPAREKLEGIDLRTRTTLLEYGVIGTGSNQRLITSPGSGNIFKDKSTSKSNKTDDSENSRSRSDSDTKLMENLLNSMTEADDENNIGRSVSLGLVGSILSNQSNEIRKLVQSSESHNLTSDELNFMKMDAKLKLEINTKKHELDKLSQNNLKAKLAGIKDKLQMVDDKLKETKEMELNESAATKSEKLQLTELLSTLRKQKSELKQFCRDEKQRLESQIELLDKKKVDNNEYSDRVKEIDKELETIQESYDNIKKQLADVNKRYALIQRKFDDVPTRTELAQYQKRFLELYNQLSNKHNETKKFYTLYNTLAEERMYLEKEFNLINSILDNFRTAHSSSAMVKEEFSLKFEQIVESIIQNKSKVEQRLQIEKQKRDQLNSEYIGLVEQQRLYFKAVKEFKEECKKNEQLIASLEKVAS